MTVKLVSKVSALALVVALSTAPMIAQAGQFRGAGAMQETGLGVNLIDTDGDGIGDTRPEPGTGMGQNAVNFVDADGDGVCDTYVEGVSQLRDGTGGNVGYRGGRE